MMSLYVTLTSQLKSPQGVISLTSGIKADDSGAGVHYRSHEVEQGRIPF